MLFSPSNRIRIPSRRRSPRSGRNRRKLQLHSLEERAVPAAPVIEPIADRTLLTNQSVLQIPVVTSDADGDQVDVAVRTAASADYFLLADLKLAKANRATNWGGAGEKWFASKGEFYFLKPNGDFFRWDGTLHQASGEELASLPPVYYQLTDLVTRPRNQDLASMLNLRLGLAPTVTPEPNTLGLNEKWLTGTGGARYFMTPDGAFYRAKGANFGAHTLYANLDAAQYQDLSLIYDATPRGLRAAVKGSMIQIESAQGAAGSFAVEVKATDGTAMSARSFAVLAPRFAAPEIPEQPPQVLGVGEQSLSFNLGATDADGDALTYTVEIAGSDAYFLAKSLALTGSTRPTNWAKQGEKWFKGQGFWYFLLPSGDLYKWDNTLKQASGDYVTTLPPVYFVYPDLLTKPRNQDLAYVLDQRLGLSPTGKPAANSLGLKEKWFGGNTAMAKFFITPEGTFYRRLGSAMSLLAELGQGYYDQPARLYAASRDRFSASVDANGAVTILTKPNFVGKFSVQVAVTDGTFTTKQIIPVTQSDYVSPAAPRLVGAVARGNRTVIVAFSQPMNNSTTDPANFEVSQLDANGNILAGLTVLSVKFIGVDRTAVELTTVSQSEVTYSVKAVNVKDLGGTAMASPFISNGVLVDPSQTKFLGKPPSAADMVDTDGDGLRDHEEQRGWAVEVKMLNGATVSRWVTSDPFDPDSDGDGLPDSQEANLRYDPRDPDTDDDQLTDYQEFNEIYSDGINQDSDGDSLDDSVEFNFYKSSVVDADTDGDQLDDGHEILLGNRNVRIADVPKPGIEIGAVDLQLDVRFTATSTKGSRELDSKSVSSTLTQSDRKEYSREDANSNEVSVRAGFSHEWSVGFGKDGTGTTSNFNVEAGWTGTWSSNFTSTSAKETANEVAKSYQSDVEATQEETVERSIEGASMKVAVSIQSLSDVAFSIKDLQITAFLQDPNQSGRLVPIATLLPDAGVANEFTLGPLVPERGPFIFTNDQIFPSLVENLMVDPRGLIFKISNYDLTDERDRNFAFSSEEINDRTAPLVIDFGFGSTATADLGGGATERYRVATSGGRIAIDTNGDGNVDGNDRPVVFDNVGRTVGITIGDAMQNIVGLTKYDEDQTPTASLTKNQVYTSYSTRMINGVERLWRVRGIANGSGNQLKTWIIFTPDGIDGTTNFSDLVVTTDGGLTFKFMQDLDNDGIDAAQEYNLGSSDTNTDTDGDGLSDAFEFYGRESDPNTPGVDVFWNIDVVGHDTIRGFSSPAREDSDLDGISDFNEFNRMVGGVRRSTDPRNPDTDGDGVSDYEEINGYEIKLRFPVGGQSKITVTSDPLDPDSDDDTLPDGDERTLGTDPTTDDADRVLDDDGDGLVNFLEDDGWDVTTIAISTMPNVQGTSTTIHVTSKKNDPDSDDDGLTDKEERTLGTNPNLADSDGDTLNDISELTITNNPDGTRTFAMKYNPLDADMDNDKRSDGAEVNTPILVSVFGATPYEVSSDPTKADADNDLLVDGDEATAGTDPTKFDTDGDNAGIGDKRETELGTNPLRMDQKVTVTITQIQLLNFDGVDEVGIDYLQIFGGIYVGKPGSMQLAYNLSDVHLHNDEVKSINVSQSFILLDGESLRVENRDLEDRDPASTPEEFANAQKDFPYAITDKSDSIQSDGVDSHEPVSDDEIGAKLVTSFTLKVEA